MARAQSQYLRIYNSSGVTLQRWQSYYANASVSWSGASWLYVPFIGNGYTAGITGDEANVSISAPAISLVMSNFEDAIYNGHLAELNIYEFDTVYGNNAPQATQTLIGSYTGQVIGGVAGLTNITLQLGSALSMVGAQIPPRKFTTAIMGKGCRL